MDCQELAATGSSPWVALAIGVLLLGAGVAALLLVRRRMRAGGSTLLIVLLLAGVVGSAGSAPAANAAEPCPTTSPSPAPTPTPTPTPTPSAGVVTANTVALAQWVPVGSCAAGAATCTFTVDVTTLGDTTTTPGAAIDYSTFTPSAAPSGYAFLYDAATNVLSVTVTATAAPPTLPTYTVTDSAGVVSNAATIELPVLTPAAFVVVAPSVGDPDLALPVSWQGAACDNINPCEATADLTAATTTSNPSATIDWTTLDLNLTTPGVQTVVSPIPGETVTFEPSTHVLIVQVDVCTVSNPIVQYTVADTAGTVSNVANIWPPAECN
ncbi:LPXTG cell wall anchor domain-containing protein [Leifsonia poae]|uniref:LPXTG cell wall anchor domain-containing protein n=1 Tax=Leifsonia poae TaxID=110933 RepID=UPI003D67EE0F